MSQLNYQSILASIARDKGLNDLAAHIESFSKESKVDAVLTESVGVPIYKYNITKMPEATCDGCQ